MIRALPQVAWRVASFPATLLHELTHYLLALPWSDESVVVIGEGGDALHAVDYRDDVPAWAPIVASLGPTMLGSLVGVIGLYRLLNSPPGGLNEWLLVGGLTAWWVIYVAPSGDDLDFHKTGESNDG